MMTPAGSDSADMLGKIRSLPEQLVAGYRLSSDAWARVEPVVPEALVIAGMGASAIGGDILRLYLAGRSAVPVRVFRDYGLPATVRDRSLVVISSYSGNTDEALACLEDALRIKARTVCVTSGGKLLGQARGNNLPVLVLPPGLPPRAALGYLFSGLLGLAQRVGLCADPGEEIAECRATLEGLNATYSIADPAANPAARLAGELIGRIPVIYCSNRLDAVGLRWKNQFCENSKRLSFVSFVPEANHNEVMGWELKEEGLSAGVMVLRTKEEHPRVARALSLTEQIVGDKARFCGEFWGHGSSLLSRVFSLILLGDYASVYLALARGVDPTPIGTIDRIKTWL
jgi:glucose/mannose-6-phosphate isomerase